MTFAVGDRVNVVHGSTRMPGRITKYVKKDFTDPRWRVDLERVDSWLIVPERWIEKR